jgi:hypothetical protein
MSAHVQETEGGFYMIDSESVTHLDTVSDAELQQLINEARGWELGRIIRA